MAARKETQRALEDQAGEAAQARAAKRLHRIRSYQEIVAATREMLGQNDFDVRAELYGLLSETTSADARAAILDAYANGLDAIDREGRLTVERLMQYETDGRPVSRVLVDTERDQVVVCIRYVDKDETNDKTKRKGEIRCYDRTTGKEQWRYPLRVQEEVTRAVMYNDLLIAIPNKDRSDSEDGADSVLALSLETGRDVWKFQPAHLYKDALWRENAEEFLGVFAGLLYVRSEDAVYALDPETGEERVRHSTYLGSAQRAVFLPQRDMCVVQLGKRKFGWFGETGELIREVELPFDGPEEESHRASIQDVALAGGSRSTELLVVVQGRWDEYDDESFRSVAQHGIEYIYAVDCNTSAFREVMRSEDFGGWIHRCALSGNRVSLVGNNQTVLISRKTGKVLARLPYEINAVNEADAYDIGSDSPFSDTFQFFARPFGSTAVRWSRPKFHLIRATATVVYGWEEEEGETWRDTVVRLVLLNAETGKELAELPLEDNFSRVAVQPIGSDQFMLVQKERVDLFRVTQNEAS